MVFIYLLAHLNFKPLGAEKFSQFLGIPGASTMSSIMVDRDP